MAYFLALRKVCHVRLATSLERGDERAEHPWILDRTKDFAGIELVSYKELPKASDILVFYTVRHGRISQYVKPWRNVANSAVYLTPTEGRISVADWLREKVRSFPHYLFARRVRFRPYLHPKFIGNSD